MTEHIIKKLDDLTEEIIKWIDSNPPKSTYYPVLLDFYVRWISTSESVDSAQYFDSKIKNHINNNHDLEKVYYTIFQEWIEKRYNEIFTWIYDKRKQ